MLFHTSGVITEQRFQEMSPMQWYFQYLSCVKQTSKITKTEQLEFGMFKFLNVMSAFNEYEKTQGTTITDSIIKDVLEIHIKKEKGEITEEELDAVPDETKELLQIFEMAPKELEVQEGEAVDEEYEAAPKRTFADFAGKLEIYKDEEDFVKKTSTDSEQ